MTAAEHRTVVFDVGNVLLYWDPALVYRGVLTPAVVHPLLLLAHLGAWIALRATPHIHYYVLASLVATVALTVSMHVARKGKIRATASREMGRLAALREIIAKHRESDQERISGAGTRCLDAKIREIAAIDEALEARREELARTRPRRMDEAEAHFQKLRTIAERRGERETSSFETEHAMETSRLTSEHQTRVGALREEHRAAEARRTAAGEATLESNATRRREPLFPIPPPFPPRAGPVPDAAGDEARLAPGVSRRHRLHPASTRSGAWEGGQRRRDERSRIAEAPESGASPPRSAGRRGRARRSHGEVEPHVRPEAKARAREGREGRDQARAALPEGARGPRHAGRHPRRPRGLRHPSVRGRGREGLRPGPARGGAPRVASPAAGRTRYPSTPMRRDDYVELRWFPTSGAAQVARTLLEAEGIEALLDPSEPLMSALASGTRGVRLHVREAERRRAEEILRETQLSERELTFLATRQLPDD